MVIADAAIDSRRKKGTSSRKVPLAVASSVAVLLVVGVMNGLLQLEEQGTRDAASTLSAEPTTIATPKVVKKAPEVCLDIQLSRKNTDRYVPHMKETEKCLLYEEPSPHIALLMKVLVGLPNQGACSGTNCAGRKDYNPEQRKYGLDWPPFGFTMIGLARMENFRAAIHEVNRNNIPGAIIELGVWRGGAMILAAAVCQEEANRVAIYNNNNNNSRELYVFDAFESIPGYARNADFLQNEMKDVQDNFDLFGVNGDNVHFVKGLFKDSLPSFKDKNIKIAVLRVDANFYDSYADALYYLYDKVPVGGIVIFDDVMTHPPVKKCWNDFKRDQGLTESLNRIDLHSAWFRKEKDIKLDMSKRLPPQDANKQ